MAREKKPKSVAKIIALMKEKPISKSDMMIAFDLGKSSVYKIMKNKILPNHPVTITMDGKVQKFSLVPKENLPTSI